MRVRSLLIHTFEHQIKQPMRTVFTFFACLLVSITFGQQIFNVDFTSATFPPAGWTFSANAANWTRVTTNNAAGTPGGEAQMSWTPQFTTGTYFISPLIDLTGKPTVSFSFNHMVDYYSNSFTIGVATRTGTGGAWTTVWSQTVTGNIAETRNILINNANTNAANFQVAIFFTGDSYDIDYWYIDDINLSAPYSLDGKLATVTNPSFMNAGSTSLTGQISNVGTSAITSFNVNYSVDGGTTNTTSVTGQNLAFGASYNYTCTPAWTATPGNHTAKVWISNVNGSNDMNHSNDTLTKLISVATQTVTMFPLFEEFTSSTCAPCASFNSSTFNPWLTSHVGTQSLIKYQMNWPAPGDVYYTTEGGTRRDYYGVSGVPDMYIQGGTLATWTTAGLTSALNAAVATPAFFTMTTVPTYSGDNVFIPVIVNPYVGGNFTLHTVVVEKTTTGNVGNNGETSFKNVMMKMFPNGAGSIVPFTSGIGYYTSFTQDLSTTNVEEMSDLQAVIFLQDNATKNVMQSYAIDIPLCSAVPAQPSAMTGSATPCQGSTQVYSVTNVANVAYNWTVPAGWVIVSGQGTNSLTVTVGATSGNVQVSPVNASGTGTARTLAITVSSLPAQPSAISGTATVCPGQTGISYNVTSVAGISYVWTVPAGWSVTAGQNTNSITVTAGSTAGNIIVTPSNLCGSGTAQTLVVTMGAAPAQPSAISGTTSPCSSTTGLTYNVTSVGGVTYNWTVPAGWSITAGQNTNSITVTSGSAAGNITVTPSNGCGNGTVQTLAVSAALAPAVTSAPSNATVGAGSNTSFTVIASNATSYQWQVSTDGGTSWNNITAAGSNPVYSGYTTSTLTLTSVVIGNNNYQYRCIVTGSCTPTATSAAATLTVNNSAAITSQPVSVGICANTNTSFSVVASGSGLTYQWQVSTDNGTSWNNITTAGTDPIYSGWTTATLSLNNTIAACNGYQYRCIVDNGTPPAATSNAAILTINVAPAQPSAISGTTTVCEAASNLTYTVTNVAGVTYTWTVPAGWNIVSGQNSNSITANAGSASGNITVTPSNTCGSGTASTVTIAVTALPAQPSAISGDVSPCAGSEEAYSVTQVAGVSYSWTFPSGWSQTSGTTSNSITANTSGASGNLIVIPSNSCGNGAAQTLTITPSLPASVDAGVDQGVNQSQPVTLNGVIGGGATSATWSGGLGTFAPDAMTLNAVYTPDASETNVTLYLTTNDPSGSCDPAIDSMLISIVSGLDNHQQSVVTVYPNPANDELFVVLPVMNGQVNITLVNSIGEIVSNETVVSDSVYRINTADMVNGVYFLFVRNNETSVTEKIILQH